MRKAKFLLMFVIFFSLVGCSNTELNVRADFYSYERNLSEISGVNEPTKLQILLEDFYLEKDEKLPSSVIVIENRLYEINNVFLSFDNEAPLTYSFTLDKQKENDYHGKIQRQTTSYEVIITFVETDNNEFMSMKVTFNEKEYILEPTLEDNKVN